MLSVCLLFVGIVLINNGVCTLLKVEAKAAAIMNLLTGGLSIFINFVSIIRGDYYAAATGLLFGFTYLFVAFNNLLHLDTCPFAVFSGFVAINAIIFGVVEGITGNVALGIIPDIRWLLIWWLWAILWGSAIVTDLMKKDLKKFVPVLHIIEGVITAWVPAVLMLLDLW